MPHRRSSARLVAPTALVAAALAVLLVIKGSGSGDDGGAEPASSGTTARPAQTRTSAARTTRTSAAATGKEGARSYTVKPGDTLSAIATATGVPLERIQELNPDLDAQTLNAGDRVKLAP